MTTRTPHPDTRPTPVVSDARPEPGLPHGRAWPDAPPVAGAVNRLRTVVAPAWRNWRTGPGIAVGGAAGWGLLAGLWTPRGPLTTMQALSAMAISLFVGVSAGIVMRSRWAVLLAPAVFVLVFELTRLSTTGPLVDGIRASEYGFIAFVAGRGFHGLLALVPMALGAAVGAAVARRLGSTMARRSGWGRAGAYLRRGVALLSAVALVALAAAVAAPAGTDPITGADGERLPGSVAELTRVEVGGHDLSLMIRGQSTANPVLLFLAGGPGGTELGAMRHHGQALEQDFVVVTWDQRGAGKSVDQLEPTSTLTRDRAVSDTLEVTNYLRDRFGQDKIYLLGQSWGTILGVLAVQAQPELFTAFIGTGQMVSPRATDRIIYRDTLAWARETANTDLVDTLTEIGPPPYRDMLNYEPALSSEPGVYPYDHTRNAEGPGQMGEGIFVGEYSLIDKVHNLGGFLDSFAVLYPQLQDIDFRDTAASLDVPVYLFQGRHEARGRAELADRWFAMLDAPRKQLTVAETSGHRPLWEQPEQFHDFMTNTVLAQTQQTG
ncbi:MAG: proline iminopeptidase [Pseudonocardiales bacterium]|nr:proline iminopeptidase [Pseudonocardiales bacterium]